MNLLYRLKRRLLTKIMAVLGFGGMAAFCVTGCDSSTQKKDNPVSVPGQVQPQNAESHVNADSNVPTPAEPPEPQATPQTAPGDEINADGIKTEDIKAEETNAEDIKAIEVKTEDTKDSAAPAAPSPDSSKDKASKDPKPAKKPRPEVQLTLYL